MSNPVKNYTIIAIGIALVAVALIFLPGWTGMDGMDGGYALSFIAAWLAISAGLIAWYLWRQAAQIERMLNGQELLAHWTYTSTEWEAYSTVEQEAQIQQNRELWLMMAGVCIVVGVVFWLIDREAGLFVLLFMLALTGLLAIVAFSLPRLRRLRQADKPGEAWLAPTAVLFDGVFYPLKSQLMWLKGVVGKNPAGTRQPVCTFGLLTLRVPGSRPGLCASQFPAGVGMRRWPCWNSTNHDCKCLSRNCIHLLELNLFRCSIDARVGFAGHHTLRTNTRSWI